MNKIKQLFNEKKSNILSVYFTAGYPELNDTTEVLSALENNGVDMVEVGIPFSDPMADGVVIQNSGTQALRNGMTLRLLFDQLETVKETIQMPLILMGYLNPIMQYGFEAFCQDCVRSGVSGMIIPDLPFKDYVNEFKPIADRYDLRVVMLITPETEEERVRLIDQHTDGFIYMVSSASTTGAQSCFDQQRIEYFARIRAMQLNNPCMVGFGISNKETFEAACRYASGAIIGSKYISLLGEEKNIVAATKKLIEILH